MKLNTLISDYTNYLTKIQHVSKNTLQSYCRDVERFMDDSGLISEADCLRIDQKALQQYIDNLKKEGFSNSTVLRSAASLKNLYGYFVSRGLILENPAAGLRLPRAKHKPPLVLTPNEINKLISAPKSDDPKGVRDRAMLELLYATGMKATELICLELRDVDLEDATVLCRSAEKTRVVPMGTSAMEAVREYVEFARQVFVSDKHIKTLFVNCHGKPMTRQGFWKLIKTYINAAGIKKSVTPQTLRHSFALHLLQNGADTESVSQMLGYNDPSSTKVYSDMLSENLKKVYNHSHPRA